jgi:TolB protein
LSKPAKPKQKCLILILLPAFFLVSFLFPSAGSAKYDYIDITNPFIKKIPIAIPIFKGMTEKSAELEKAREAADLLSETLNFTGFFKIIDRGAFLANPEKTGISDARINFRNWTAIGAELLVTGGISITEDRVRMEIRLFDTFKATRLIGKKYTGGISDQRRMIHRFCNDVIYLLTGSHGIFESKIAFVSTSTGKKEIYICDFDGYRPRKITQSNTISLSPAWSSDGNWLAYTSYSRGKPDLFIKNLREKKGSVVAKSGINIAPAWIPGKFALAATLSFSGDPEIYMLTGTGKIIKRLTRRWGIDVSPSFSPDGRKMVFVSKRSGTPQLYILDLSSERTERLTFQGKYNTTPSWSPRGDKIAYSALDNGSFNIYLIGADGVNLTQLTHDSGNNEAPTWSPDGSLIAFSSDREGVSRVYVMTSHGTEQRRLLSMPGEQTNPKWSPKNIAD